MMTYSFPQNYDELLKVTRVLIMDGVYVVVR